MKKKPTPSKDHDLSYPSRRGFLKVAALTVGAQLLPLELVAGEPRKLGGVKRRPDEADERLPFEGWAKAKLKDGEVEFALSLTLSTFGDQYHIDREEALKAVLPIFAEHTCESINAADPLVIHPLLEEAVQPFVQAMILGEDPSTIPISYLYLALGECTK